VLGTLDQTDQFHVTLRGFGIEMRPFKDSMEHGEKDISLNDTSKQIEMQSVNDEMIF
jgi:hypothetical protein